MTRRLLKYPALSLKLGGRSRASIQRDMRDRGFPLPINLAPNSVVWDEGAVDAWIEEMAKVKYQPVPVAVPKPGNRRGRKPKNVED